jgi:hypothetical protein
MKKLKISKKNLKIVKTFIQSQILLETLDELKDESSYLLKLETKKYINKLEEIVEPIILNMYESNPELFLKMSNELRKDIKKIQLNFETI